VNLYFQALMSAYASVLKTIRSTLEALHRLASHMTTYPYDNDTQNNPHNWFMQVRMRTIRCYCWPLCLYFRLFTKMLYITLNFGVWDPCLHFSSLQVWLSKCGPTYKVFQTYYKVDLAPNRQETKCHFGESLCVFVPSHWVHFSCRFIWNIRTTDRLYPGLSNWTTTPHSATAWKMSELPPQCRVTLTFFLIIPVPTPSVLPPAPWSFPWTQNPTRC